MSEFDEFAEALMGQLSVEIDEEKVIAELAKKIKEDRSFTVEFDDIESVSKNLFVDLVQSVNKYMGLEVSKELSIEYLKLDEFKRLKGKKVITENGRIYAVSNTHLTLPTKRIVHISLVAAPIQKTRDVIIYEQSVY